MFLGIQIFGALFGLFLAYLAFLSYKRKEFSRGEWLLWSVAALGLLLLSLFPQVLDPVKSTLSISRKMDLLIIMGFIFLIAGMFYTYATAMKTQKKIEELVRKSALEGTDRKQTNRKV